MPSLFFALMATIVSLPAFADCSGRTFDGPTVLNPPLCLPAEPKRIIALVPTFRLGMPIELGMPVVGAPLYGMSDEI